MFRIEMLEEIDSSMSQLMVIVFYSSLTFLKLLSATQNYKKSCQLC